MYKRTVFVILALFLFSCETATINSEETKVVNEQNTNVPDIATLTNSEVSVDFDSPLGINLSEIIDYSDEDPFLDYMKTSRAWFGQTDSEFDTQEYEQINLDSNGWVRSLRPLGSARFTRVVTIMMTSDNMHNNYSGDYVVLYNGTGKLDYGNASLLDSSSGRDVIRIDDPAGYLQIKILDTDEQNYLRDIHVVRKEYEQEFLNGSIFNPRWLEKLKPFRTIRFMDWMRVNGGKQTDFTLRSSPTDARYTSELGAPLEVMLSLTNQLHTEPWFNMPTQSDDNYMHSFAEMVHQNLDPSLKVYVEYSNEVWNTGFSFHPQGSYVDQQAVAEFGNIAQQDFFTARLNWHGKRTAEMCQIWKTVFKGEEGRVICVLGAQAANTYTAEQALDCPLWSAQTGKRCQDFGVDAVAIAPYFGSYIGDVSWQDQVQEWTVDQLFDEIISGGLIRDPIPGDFNDPNPQGAFAEAHEFMDSYSEHAKRYGYHLLAYEAGQHLAGIGATQDNKKIVELFLQGNRDPRMGDIYSDYLQMWQEAHGETFVLFNFAGRYGRFGSWGLMEYIEQPSSPKYDAVVDFASGNACWWADCAVR
ncbi:MAG: hypothetical protein U0X74_03365 [Anaerolineales bacterium]